MLQEYANSFVFYYVAQKISTPSLPEGHSFSRGVGGVSNEAKMKSNDRGVSSKYHTHFPDGFTKKMSLTITTSPQKQLQVFFLVLTLFSWLLLHLVINVAF